MKLATMEQVKNMEDSSDEMSSALEMLGVLVMVVLTLVIGRNSMDRDVINFLRDQIMQYRRSRDKGITVSVQHLIVIAIILLLAKLIASMLINCLRDQIAKYIKPRVKGILVKVQHVIVFAIILVVAKVIATMLTDYMTHDCTHLVPT